MTSTLHRFPDETAFDHQRRIADLDYLTSSRAAMMSLAEQYVGLPLDVRIEEVASLGLARSLVLGTCDTLRSLAQGRAKAR
jgi:hypothetical protein